MLLSVAWVAFKVGALSYGGGFVIIPLMQSDAVSHYHWMTGGQFLNAVALGQITPGPRRADRRGRRLRRRRDRPAACSPPPSRSRRPSPSSCSAPADFDRLRGNQQARAFLDGAGPAAIGAILGSAITLARALTEPWQYAVLAAAAIALLGLRRGVVLTLLAAAATGVLIALAGGQLPP